MESRNDHRVLLSDLAIICTEKQFRELCLTDSSLLEKEYVYMSVMQYRGELCGGIKSGELPPNSVAIVPNKSSAGFLAFLLTSFPCQFFLFDGKINIKGKTRISKKVISKLVVFKVDEKIESVYAVAEDIKEQAYKLYESDRENLVYHHFYGLVADLCNILAMELYTNPLFEIKGISIYKYWEELVQKYQETDNTDILFDGLVQNDSMLRNQILKVHMFADNIEDIIKDQTDGMED